ncbi:LysM peptidoglycan-binding domain-containing protein [Mesorhizobium sp. A556]
MAITSLRALLFTAGGVVVVGGAAYVSGAFDRTAPVPAPVAVATTEPAPAATASGTAGRVGAPASDAPAADAPAVDAPAAGAMAPVAPSAMAPQNPDTKPAAPPNSPAAAGVVAPTFDVVRVQGNGSVVIAGKAAPNSKVEIVHGSVVLGNTMAGADGTFAIVLDDPLKPGDYQIVLRSTAPDDVVATSEQTAVVSVPEQAGGQVLAMVEEPGKPAELLTVPEPEKKAETPAAPAPTAETAPAETPAAQAVPAAPAPTAAETPAPAPAATEAPAKAEAGPKIAVEAVEIDGSKIFIAGIADAGRKVRAYANDILLGEAVTSPDGHFLVEATRDIPVGDYTVRVDALDADGVKVAARATVPFEREPGETIAAVAPAAAAKPAQADEKVADATQPAAPQPGATEPVAAPATVETPDGETPDAAVPETTAPKLQHADGAVIIRRGDSLWRISRRVYGRGIRYSTIYLANQKQISDPDMIWPGQVFTVPDKSKEGDSADLKALGEQATTVPAQ